jgi:hypothetical protein
LNVLISVLNKYSPTNGRPPIGDALHGSISCVKHTLIEVITYPNIVIR